MALREAGIIFIAKVVDRRQLAERLAIAAVT
jgi:hypothetical protein